MQSTPRWKVSDIEIGTYQIQSLSGIWFTKLSTLDYQDFWYCVLIFSYLCLPILWLLIRDILDQFWPHISHPGPLWTLCYPFLHLETILFLLFNIFLYARNKRNMGNSVMSDWRPKEWVGKAEWHLYYR